MPYLKMMVLFSYVKGRGSHRFVSVGLVDIIQIYTPQSVANLDIFTGILQPVQGARKISIWMSLGFALMGRVDPAKQQ